MNAVRLAMRVGMATGMVAVIVCAGHGSAVARDKTDDGQWFHSFMGTAAAHKTTKGAGVTVAVVDTGVDASHPDLAGSVLAGADFSEEGPGDGRTDRYGHGTAMAGLIAAHGRVTGVAPAAKILPVRTSVSFAGGGGLAQGITWATEQKADVISVSSMLLDDDLVVRRAVESAIAADIVVVVGTGNRTESGQMSYLARIGGVVAVGGVDRKGLHSAISVSGAETLLAAPCDEVSSTYPGGKWTTNTGTSNSTALVAGAAALIRAEFPDMSAAEVVHRMTATAVDKGFRGPDGEYGYGVIDIVAALTADVLPLSPAASLSRGAASGKPADPEPGSDAPFRVLIPVAVVVLAILTGIGSLSWRRSR